MLAINEVLQQGRYRIVNHFRQSGKGTVYQAFDNVLETNVLLKENMGNSRKVITVSQMEKNNSAFANEAKVLTNIKHESILDVRDYFSEIDRQYLVLEYTDGNDLSELLKNNEDSFALADVTNWADQLLNALNYLHSHIPPIIHRDINPQNLRLTADGKIKLFAFELSKNSDEKVNPAISNQNFIPSALHYLPLEQIWDGLDSATQRVINNSYDEKSMRILEKTADVRSDIYALGATLYHLLTGQFPTDSLERSIDILEGKPDPLPVPHKINSNIPPEISEVLMKAMEIKREDRFFSVVIMRQVLRTALVRVKEREAQEVSGIADPIESTSAENQELEAKCQLAEQKRLEAEEEQKRQQELIRQQLLEAKAQKLKAAQLAAELEKQRVEQAAGEIKNKESLASAIQHPVVLAAPLVSTKPIPSPSILPKPVKTSVKSDHSSVEFNELFATPPKNNKVWRQMSAIAVVLILIGGGIVGFLFLQTDSPNQLNQTLADAPVSTEEKVIPESTIEAVPVLKVESTPEIKAAPTPNLSSAFTETQPNQPTVQPTVKIKSPSPRVEKPASSAIKSPPKKPKTITVEDLINN